MMYNNIDFGTYFKNYPDADGYFGKYGGSYIPPKFQTKSAMHIRRFVSRESLSVSCVESPRNSRADLRRFHIWQDCRRKSEQGFSSM